MTTRFLFIVLFVTGIIPNILSVPRKYYLIKSKKTWSDAQAYCQANHNDLAIINSAANLLRLQNDAQGTLNGVEMWIGAYIIPTKFLWSFGNESLGLFSNWAPGYPNNIGGKRFCVMITPTGWYTAVCTQLCAFMCYDGSRSGTDRYIYYSTVKTWSDAQSFCRQTHTDLASARDATEHSDIMAKVSGDTWFGLFKEPWKWLDQTEMLLPWISGQPDNYYGDEYFGFLNNYKVGDTHSIWIWPFLCHREVTGQQQILRFNLESIQDANDPAINAAILKLIQQKLKDHGIEQTITLKWKKQPGVPQIEPCRS